MLIFGFDPALCTSNDDLAQSYPALDLNFVLKNILVVAAHGQGIK
jgi:hypothetical protein